MADHRVVGIDLRVKGRVKSNKEFWKRKWKDFDQKRYNEKVKNVNWNTMYEMDNINVASHFFEENMKRIMETEMPLVKIQPRGNFKPWISTSTKDMMEERDELHEFARITGDDETWTQFRSVRNKCTVAVKKDRKDYFGNMYDKCESEKDVAQLYKITKRQLGREGGGPPVSFQVDGKIVSAPKELADIQINHCHDKNNKLMEEVATNVQQDPTEVLRRVIERRNSQRLEEQKLEIRQITLKGTAEIFSKLGNSTSRGYDNLDALSLKLAATELIKPV